MRITRILTAATVVAAALAPAQAQAAAPRPAECTGAVSGVSVPGNPGGLVSTAAVVVVTAVVECHRDLLTSSPNGHREAFAGHLDVDIVTADTGQLVCNTPVSVHETPGAVLVMHYEYSCTIPLESTLRTHPLRALARWATYDPYVCCEGVAAAITPAGAAVNPAG